MIERLITIGRFTGLVLIAVVLLVIALLAHPAHSQEAPPCDWRMVITADLNRQGLEVVAEAAIEGGDLMQIMAAADGRVAVLVTYAKPEKLQWGRTVYTLMPGMTCISYAGHGWQLVAPQGRAL